MNSSWFDFYCIVHKKQTTTKQVSKLSTRIIRYSNFTCLCLLFMMQCNSNFEYRISKISNEQCYICRYWSKSVSNAMGRVYPSSFSWKLVYEIKFDAPIRSHHVCKETWTLQKDGILHCKKEVFDIDKHAVDINKEDRLVAHAFMRGDPMDYVSRKNLSWPRLNIFTKANVMKVRNLFLWRAMGGSTILWVVMVFRYIVKQQQYSKILNG